MQNTAQRLKINAGNDLAEIIRENKVGEVVEDLDELEKLARKMLDEIEAVIEDGGELQIVIWTALCDEYGSKIVVGLSSWFINDLSVQP